MGITAQHRSLSIRVVSVALTCLVLGLLVYGLFYRVHAQQGTTEPQPEELLNTSLWKSPPVPLANAPAAVSLKIATTPQGDIHIIWESQGRLYHTWRPAGGTWQDPTPIWWGLSPSLAVDAQNRVHLVFVQDVLGNFEVYYTSFDGRQWSLPRNVSNTPGHSYSPYIDIAPDGTLQVVWNERVGTRDVIYHAELDGVTWVDFPIPSAWGKAPTLHIIGQMLHVIWQGPSLSSSNEVYHIQGVERTWRLPQNLSDSPQSESVGVESVVDAYGWIHATWLEENGKTFRVQYTYGNGDTWRWPLDLSDSGVGDVTIATSERGNYVHVWWADESGWWTRWRAVASPEWSTPTRVTSEGANFLTFRFAPQNDTRLRALWRSTSSEGVELWYAEAKTPIVQRLRFALLGRNAPWGSEEAR